MAKRDTSVTLGDLTCAGCGGAWFRSCGMIHKKRQYGCVGCGKRVLLVAEEPKSLPCPYCREPCVKNGFGKGRRQRYLCRACGHTSLDLFPADRLEDLGAYRKRLRFGLDIPARDGLMTFCLARGMRETEAVRAIFRASRCAPLLPQARARWEAKRETRRPATQSRSEKERAVRLLRARVVPAVMMELPRRLPDARSEATRARLGGRPVYEAARVRTADVRYQVSVMLDAESMAGLLEAMAALETQNRQEAARFLLADALTRFGEFVTMPKLCVAGSSRERAAKAAPVS